MRHKTIVDVRLRNWHAVLERLSTARDSARVGRRQANM